ncbi:MAG TPA: SusD/RagB family nutrient-binding outer membrane lipoprotein, partial [Gemmatimonadales bacterium]
RLLGLLIVVAPTVTCRDAYDSLFLDPDRSTTARIEYLFTQGLLDADFPIHYGEWFWQVYHNVAAWAQVSGTQNDVDMMRPLSDQWQNNWTDYYARAAMDVREIRKIYDALPGTQQASYEAYIHLGKVVNAFTTARTTDLWGDMPYSEAFTARQTAGQNLFPKFDTQESVYDAILQDLKDASDALRNLTVVHSGLAAQDLLLKGDITGWRRFANSLRLRLAMRLSEVAPVKAQAIVQEILADPAAYPLVEANGQNVAWYMDPSWVYDHNSLGNRCRAARELPQQTWAPKVMLDMMVSANDPRLAIVFDTLFDSDSATPRYIGLPSSPDDQPTTTIDSTRFSRLNSLMFRRNNRFPGYVMTAAEVAFLESEARMRGWATGDPKAAYDEALRLSVEMYYATYNANDSVPASAKLTAPADLTPFINSPKVVYNGTLERIATQKWIHLGIVQPYEAWAELRRTDYPALPPDRLGGRLLERTVRIVYPSTEITNNRQSYEAVRAKDTPTTRVWWDVR